MNSPQRNCPGTPTEESTEANSFGLKDKLWVWGGLVPCVVVGGGVVEFVPGDCVAPSGETSLGDV